MSSNLVVDSYLEAFAFKRIYQSFAVLFAADLTGNVNVRLARIKRRAEPVMLNGENVCALLGDVVEQLNEVTGLIKKRCGEAQVSVACGKTLLNNALDKTDVDVAAGEQAHDLFTLDIDLSLENCGNGGRAARQRTQCLLTAIPLFHL